MKERISERTTERKKPDLTSLFRYGLNGIRSVNVERERYCPGARGTADRPPRPTDNEPLGKLKLTRSRSKAC